MAKIYKIALISLFFSILPIVAQAATLYFSPSAGSYNISDTFSASIFVSSADQAMNAASGIISFPQDKLEVTSLSKSGSIFTLWVQEPLFSNAVGTINLEGIVLNPGFTGVAGKIITLTLKVKAAGTALLNFSSGSVLANDGKGTNILTGLASAQFSLGGVAQTVPQATTPPPSAPQVSSPTHPDSNKWYSINDAKFTWPLPTGVNGVRLLVGRIPDAVPTVTYAPPVSSKEVTDLPDGILYFHVQFRNEQGWGAVSHFRFQIDTQPPEPTEILQPATTSEESIIEEPPKQILAVKQPEQPAFFKIGTKAASFIVLAIMLVALLISLILLLWYGWRSLSSLKRRVKKEVNEAEKALQIAFNLLRKNVREQIKILENVKAERQLTKEEEKIVKQLRQNLDDAEKFVRKEIKDIEKLI